MPTIYKPILNHLPIEPCEVAKAIEKFLDENLTRLINFGRGEDGSIEDDDREHMRQQMFARLFQFAASCIARPIRATNKVITTVRRIGKDPEHFIANPEAYDPEATDALFVEFQRLSTDHKRIAHQFWIGQGVLDPEDVRQAARAAIIGYRDWHIAQRTATGKTACGAPANLLLREFANLSADLFRMVGGMPTSTDEGAFRRFVELLRKPVLNVAMAAGCALTPVSIIRLAAKSRARSVARRPKTRSKAG